MKTLLAVAALAIAANSFSQQQTVSPEVQSNGCVTFRLRAPNAKEVQVRCESLPASSMKKDEQGVWSFTTPPLEPDIYTYSFVVDGLRTLDLNNPLMKYNLLNSDSQVHVPGPSSLAWEVNDVPHGIVHRHFYHSSVANDDRDFYVYTPPGYESSRKKLPVLYLLHGYSDDATAWVSVGCANTILDNLIARKQAKPMIVVMPLGYGTMEIVKQGWGRVRSPDLSRRNVNGFRDALLTEVMPQVEKDYRASTDRNQRAIAGLSMGGAESLTTGLNTMDKFAWVGAFSSGGLSTNFDSLFPKLDSKANSKLRLLWIACGKEDGLFPVNQKLSDWLDAKGVKHNWVQTPGGHAFRVWRRNLAEFAPLLFQELEK
jgi:enterochelin esterase-like enzyme